MEVLRTRADEQQERLAIAVVWGAAGRGLERGFAGWVPKEYAQ